ncbi:MAG: PD-(D/E)XK nuclease family protein [Nitrospirota bacterium]|nr:PD-(D/E)XK nuclease family protein [Nitrospirota bacterium]
MKVRIISPGKSLIEEIIPNLKKRERDYSSNLVVFPGRRPSHFLRKALAREMQGSFVPPAIFSMDEFVDYLYERKSSERKLDGIDAVSLLYDIHRRALTPLGGGSFMAPDSFFPLGIKIYRDIEELYIEGIDHHLVKAIEPYAEEAIPEQTVKRLQSLSFFYEEFYKTVRLGGFSTRSMRYRAAAEMIDDAGTDNFQQVIFAGFFALTRYEKALFRKLLAADSTLFIFQDGRGMKEKLADLGICPVGEEGDGGTPEVHFYSSPDTHGQVFALRSVLERKSDEHRFLFENTAIVLPSAETLFPLLRQGIAGIDEDSYNISLGYPLQRTPVFAFLNNIMELITSMDGDRVYVPDYLNFVLHPYTKNIYCSGSAEITRILFHTLEEKLTKYRTKTFVSLAEIEGDDKLFELVMNALPQVQGGMTKELLKSHLRDIHHNTIEKLLAFRDVSAFSQKCTEVLTYIFNNSTAKLHPLFYPFSESFIRSLEVISRSLMKDVVFAERSSYFTFFRKYIMTCHTPFEGTPVKGLQILGFLETRNLRFKRVFVLDANEEVLPDTKKEDTLLPFRAREILGLTTHKDRDALAAYNFGTLLQGAEEVHLFFIENDKKERSRFVERLLWERQRRDKTTDTENYLASVQYKIELKNPVPADIAKTDDLAGFLRDFSYSASALDTYLRCPLQFYYSYVLRLDKKEEMSGDIERVDIGKFVHNVLSQYFEKRKNRLLQEKDIDLDELNALAGRLFSKEYGENPSGAVYLLGKQIKRHLRDFFLKYFFPLIREEKVTVLSCEDDMRITKYSFHLRGRADAVFKRGDKTVIVDYKTGSNPDYLSIKFDRLDIHDRESWGEAVGSIQLPFYLLLYAGQSGKAIQELNGMFLLLGRSVINREIELPLFSGQNEEGKFELMKDLIFSLLREITDPAVPFSPSNDRKKRCPDCSYQYICGTQWIVK